MCRSRSILYAMSSTGLPTRTLGRTGLQVTQLGYGAMELGGAPRGPVVDDALAEQILGAFVDGGINYIDTSIDYGGSEERTGATLGSRRSEFYLASKCGCVVNPPPGERPEHVFTRENVVADVYAEARRRLAEHTLA